jgi:hypothetical protein
MGFLQYQHSYAEHPLPEKCVTHIVILPLPLTVVLKFISASQKVYLVILTLPTLVPSFDFCIDTAKVCGVLLNISSPVLQREQRPSIFSLLVLIVEFRNSYPINLHFLVNSNNWILGHVEVCRAQRLISVGEKFFEHL